MVACVVKTALFVAVLSTVGLCNAVPLVPVDGRSDAVFSSLPDATNAKQPFETPKEENVAPLPSEPTYLGINVGGKLVEYWYSAEDTVEDIFKYVSERAHVDISDMVNIFVVKFNPIGREYILMPYSTTRKLKDVPLVAGDELEVKFKEGFDTSNLVVDSSPAATHGGSIPGYYDINFKITGMPLITAPIPRVAKGGLIKTLVEDRCALTSYDVELRRMQRTGSVLRDADLIAEQDTLFWGTLVSKQDPSGANDEPDCEYGQVVVVTNLGKSHVYNYDCKTTAQNVLTTMQNLGLVPTDEQNVYASGIFVSTKGFFHEAGLDTLQSDALLVDNGVKHNGMVFVTVACPTTLVYFQYLDATFPQIVNCTSTINYMTSLFWGIHEHNGHQPKYFFVDNSGERRQLVKESPIAQQLSGMTHRIVTIEYPASPSSTPSPSRPPSASPSPSPSKPARIVDNWDSQEDREAPPPANAVPLGGGLL